MLILLFSSLILHAQITCTHPQLCNMASELAAQKLEVNSPLPSNVDPHHFEPNLGLIKKFNEAKLLLTPPIALQPWLKNVLRYRAKKGKPTLTFKSLALSKDKGMDAAYAHVWMYPESLCFNWGGLRAFMVENKLKVKEDDCPNPGAPLKSVNKTFVLTHDALLPLLKRYSSNVIALKTSDHHAQVLPSTLKKLAQLENSANVIWILEKNIAIPDQMIKRFKKDKQGLKIFDLDGTIGEKTNARFLDLMKKIEL